MKNKFDVIEASIGGMSVLGFILSKTEKRFVVCFKNPETGEVETKGSAEGLIINNDADYSDLPASLQNLLEFYKNQDSRTFNKGDVVSFTTSKSRKILKGVIESSSGKYARVLIEDGSYKRVLKTSFH